MIHHDPLPLDPPSLGACYRLVLSLHLGPLSLVPVTDWYVPLPLGPLPYERRTHHCPLSLKKHDET